MSPFSKWLSVILLFAGSIALAQQYRGTIRLDDPDKIFLNQIHITNLRTGKSVRADFEGRFSLEAQSGDRVVFTSLYTDRKEQLLRASDFSSEQIIRLSISYFEMKEVVISGFTPTGILQRDVLRLKTGSKKQDLIDKIGLPQAPQRNAVTEEQFLSMNPDGIGLNIISILDALTGERKNKIRAKKYEFMLSQVKKVHSYFGDAYFIEKKIPANRIDDFLQFIYYSEGGKLYDDEFSLNIASIYIDKYLPVYQKRLKNLKTNENGEK